jgi:predicted acetyltransferase
VQLEVSTVAYGEKSILGNLMQYYLYELNPEPGKEFDDKGQLNYSYLDHYWVEPDRYPYLVRADGRLAGFALLKKGTYFPQQVPIELQGMQVAEFFIVKGFRRQGAGSKVAVNLFARFPGRWEIAQEAGNLAGQAFWRAVLEGYCGGKFKEFILDNECWRGPVQVFDSTSLGAKSPSQL